LGEGREKIKRHHEGRRRAFVDKRVVQKVDEGCR